ncbi:MAG TPA: sortase [Candidatus Paceibacterota bacterium]|nr:sortase [Candidatus Paceibacterota bacterium]
MDITLIVDLAVRLIRAVERAYAKKGSFFGIFVLIFVGSIFVLDRLDLLPDAPTPIVSVVASRISTSTPDAVPELPTKIEIPAINLTATIANPTTLDVVVLDRDLLQGAVRYPTSAKLGETGNVVLFGHSSYLPIVLNQAYKTFDGIQKLVAGDVVTVYSSDTAYTYRVQGVTKESAASDAGIPLSVTGRELTLATCDSFGEKTDRFVVTADFVESHPISG